MTQKHDDERVKEAHYVAKSAWGGHLISVLATDDDDARAQIAEQLQRNPSRVPYYNQWVDGGRIISQEVWDDDRKTMIEVPGTETRGVAESTREAEKTFVMLKPAGWKIWDETGEWQVTNEVFPTINDAKQWCSQFGRKVGEIRYTDAVLRRSIHESTLTGSQKSAIKQKVDAAVASVLDAMTDLEADPSLANVKGTLDRAAKMLQSVASRGIESVREAGINSIRPLLDAFRTSGVAFFAEADRLASSYQGSLSKLEASIAIAYSDYMRASRTMRDIAELFGTTESIREADASDLYSIVLELTRLGNKLSIAAVPGIDPDKLAATKAAIHKAALLADAYADLVRDFDAVVSTAPSDERMAQYLGEAEEYTNPLEHFVETGVLKSAKESPAARWTPLEFLSQTERQQLYELFQRVGRKQAIEQFSKSSGNNKSLVTTELDDMINRGYDVTGGLQK